MPIYIDIDGGNCGDADNLRFFSSDKAESIEDMSDSQLETYGQNGLSLRYIIDEFNEESTDELNFWLGFSHETDEDENEDEDDGDEDEIDIPEDED